MDSGDELVTGSKKGVVEAGKVESLGHRRPKLPAVGVATGKGGGVRTRESGGGAGGQSGDGEDDALALGCEELESVE